MRFTIHKSTYSAVLDKVKRALSKDEECLRTIYHEASSEGLRLIASDSNVRIEYLILPGEHLQVHQPGSFCPHGQKISDLVKGFPDLPVTVYGEENEIPGGTGDANQDIRCYLEVSKSEIRKLQHWVPCDDARKYPLNDFKVGANKQKVTFNDPDVFVQSIRNTEYAALKEMSILANAYIEVENGVVRAVATDRNRLSYYSTNTDVVGNANFTMVCAYAREAIGLLNNINPISIEVGDSVILVKQDQLRYYCRRMQSDYVEWKTKIGFETDGYAKVNKAEVLEALKNILTFTDFACKLVFSEAEQNLKIIVHTMAGNPVYGGSVEVIPCVVKGNYTMIVVPRFLLEALNHSKQEEVEFLLNDGGEPFKLNLDPSLLNIITTLGELPDDAAEEAKKTE